jgi:hypothetical protein
MTVCKWASWDLIAIQKLVAGFKAAITSAEASEMWPWPLFSIWPSNPEILRDSTQNFSSHFRSNTLRIYYINIRWCILHVGSYEIQTFIMREKCSFFCNAKAVVKYKSLLYYIILHYITLHYFIFAFPTVLCLHHAVLKLNTIRKFGVCKCSRCNATCFKAIVLCRIALIDIIYLSPKKTVIGLLLDIFNRVALCILLVLVTESLNIK